YKPNTAKKTNYSFQIHIKKNIFCYFPILTLVYEKYYIRKKTASNRGKGCKQQATSNRQARQEGRKDEGAKGRKEKGNKQQASKQQATSRQAVRKRAASKRNKET
ncbi:MAG: hypothetical protein LBL13_11885, partial [Bacteroidales bacterium]|nr:hypothetical protein [Bacteroidales bacterium]